MDGKTANANSELQGFLGFSAGKSGSIAVFAGGMMVGLTALFTRLSETNDPFTLQLLRTAPFGLVLLATMIFTRRAELRLPTRRELLLGCGLVGCFYGFMLGMTNTSVARALFALTTYPLWAALLGWLVLRERLNRVTLIALGLAVSGLAVMSSSGFFGEALSPRDLLGMSAGLVGGICCGALLVIIRLPESKWPGDITRGYFLGSIFICLIALYFGGVPSASSYDIGIGIAHGFLGLGLSFFLIAWGTKRIASARAGMFLAMEVVSGPLLVWLFLGETDSAIVYVGGALVLAASLLLALKGGS